MKIKVYKLLSFILGLMSLSLGVVLVVKSNFGISVVTSSSYIYSERFKALSLGQWTYIIQGVIFLLTIVVVKKLKLKYLLSFIVGYLFGEAVDFWVILWDSVNNTDLYFKIMLYVFGTLATAIGVSLFIRSKYPVIPFDNFVKEISEVKNINFGMCKMYFDFVMLTFSVISSFLFFKTLIAVHIGTLISAFVIGPLIKITIENQNKFITDVGIIDQNKADLVLEYDFFKPIKDKLYGVAG